MARLNEPPIAPAPSLLSTIPAGPESLEARKSKQQLYTQKMRTKPRPSVDQKAATDIAEVKRRFTRQNRELAKNNSAQSLKIRGLEGEVTKLLGANLELRQRCMRLQRKLKSEGANGGLERIQRELRRKLNELGGLVEGMQSLRTQPDEMENEDDQQDYEVDLQRILSPSQQQYRERQPLGELMRDSQMPTIAEGKSYPRQTMDASEIRALRMSDGSGATGSPDLGPPPVARFDCEDNSGEELLPSVNLETRRKRKDGPSEREIRRSSILALSPVKLDVEPAATSMLRTGAKRKLADREGEKAAKKDDFSFTRKPAVEVKKDDENEEKVSTSPAKLARKVLGDKSVNMSPRKTAPVGKAAKPAKEEPIKPKPAPRSQPTARPPSRGRRTSSTPAPHETPAMASIELPPVQARDLPPKTPAPTLDDPFSPSTASVAQQSLQTLISRDTPPPSDLSSLSNTTTETRPSRRARSSVNYAEPSLVAKMRRPGKGMVDAISGLPAARRSISVDATVIKVEPIDDDDEWRKAREGSPSTRAEKSTTIPAPSGDEDKVVVKPRRESSAVVAESRRRREAIPRPTSSPATLDKLSDAPIVETKAENLKNLEVEEKERKKAEMDVFEFKDESSSPVVLEVGKGRRHSSVLNKDVGKTSGAKVSSGGAPAAQAGSRRRSMVL